MDEAMSGGAWPEKSTELDPPSMGQSPLVGGFNIWLVYMDNIWIIVQLIGLREKINRKIP